MTLYEIAGEAADLQAAFDQAETAEEMEAVMDAYDGVMEDFDRKAENYIKLLRNKESEAKALRDEEKRLAGRRKACEALAGRLKDTLRQNMDFLGIKNMTAGVFKMAIQKNGGRPPVVIEDEGKIPEEFWDVTRAVNKGRLYEAMAVDGEIVDGAYIGEPGESLRIR